MEHRSYVDVPDVAELAANGVSDPKSRRPPQAAVILRDFGIPVFIVR